MKTSKRKKLERIEIMRPLRVAMAPACPNCGGKGAHFMPPVTWYLGGGLSYKEPGEFICQPGHPLFDAEIVSQNVKAMARPDQSQPTSAP